MLELGTSVAKENEHVVKSQRIGKEPASAAGRWKCIAVNSRGPRGSEVIDSCLFGSAAFATVLSS